MEPAELHRLKVELCCGMRALHRFGAASPFIAGHVSAKLDQGRLLVNRFGASFAAVVPDDLLVVDMQGAVVDGAGRVNDTVRLHCAIHARCPEVALAAHSHARSVVALSTLGITPAIYDQESCALAGAVMLLDKQHDSLDTTPAVAEAFASHPEMVAIIAPNHGAFTRGATIPSGIVALLVLEHMCRRNLEVLAAARAAGVAARPIPAAAASAIRSQQRALDGLSLLWEDLMARLRPTDADLVSLRDRARAGTS